MVLNVARVCRGVAKKFNSESMPVVNLLDKLCRMVCESDLN
jgi:hypothetical protein